MSSVITTQNLSRHFQDGENIIKAVDDVSLNIEAGEFTAIIGPSGSGKSTLLNLIGGLNNSTSGAVELSGTDIAKMSGSALSDFRRDHIGFIFQSYNLIPVLSAEENIEYIMLLQGVDTATRKKRVREMLHVVGLEGLGDRRPSHLSGGQQQRVAIARAMASHPDIILADEPTANLDSKTGIALLEVMKSLNEDRGMTFIFSTHDNKIMDRARRLVHVLDGKVDQEELK